MFDLDPDVCAMFYKKNDLTAEEITVSEGFFIIIPLNFFFFSLCIFLLPPESNWDPSTCTWCTHPRSPIRTLRVLYECTTGRVIFYDTCHSRVPLQLCKLCYKPLCYKLRVYPQTSHRSFSSKKVYNDSVCWWRCSTRNWWSMLLTQNRCPLSIYQTVLHQEFYDPNPSEYIFHLLCFFCCCCSLHLLWITNSIENLSLL